jgi:hypothetical protein
MTDLVTELAAQGRTLPPAERVCLLDLLRESLHETSTSEIKAGWNADISCRVACNERGEVRFYDAEEVMAEAARIAPRSGFEFARRSPTELLDEIPT